MGAEVYRDDSVMWKIKIRKINSEFYTAYISEENDLFKWSYLWSGLIIFKWSFEAIYLDDFFLS